MKGGGQLTDQYHNYPPPSQVYSDGVLTPILDKLPVSSVVEVSLPEGIFSHDQLTTATSTALHLVLLAAGTGLTPMVRLMLLALKSKKLVCFLFSLSNGNNVNIC